MPTFNHPIEALRWDPSSCYQTQRLRASLYHHNSASRNALFVLYVLRTIILRVILPHPVHRNIRPTTASRLIAHQAHSTPNSGGNNTNNHLTTTLMITQFLALRKISTYASLSLTFGNSPSGLSFRKNAHSGPHPSFTSKTNSRFLRTTLFTNSLCSRNVFLRFSSPKSFPPQPFSMICLYAYQGLTKSLSRWRRRRQEGQFMTGMMVLFIEASQLSTGRCVRMNLALG